MVSLGTDALFEMLLSEIEQVNAELEIMAKLLHPVMTPEPPVMADGVNVMPGIVDTPVNQKLFMAQSRLRMSRQTLEALRLRVSV